MQEIFKIDYFFKVFPKILRYMPTTLSAAFLALLFAVAFGLILAIIRQYKIKFLYGISGVFISFFRSVPFIAQLFLFYYGVAQFSTVVRDMSQFTAMVTILSLSFSAYMAENIRAAINSVEKGQYEACLSIGMTPVQAIKRVILPQAARVAIPGMSNSFVNLLKSTAIGFSIGLKDMMAGASMEISISYRYLECYVAVALIYWLLIAIFTYLQGKMERKLGQAY